MPAPIPRDQWTGPLPPPTPPSPTERPEDVQNIRRIGWLLDEAFEIPGTKFRIGLDPLIGLIPGIGDAIAFLIGSYILVTAAKLGVPRVVIVRMLANIGIDTLLGAIPLVGDVFDAAWRANAKNAALLEKALEEPQRTRRSSTWQLIGLVVLVFVLVFGGLTLTIWLASALIRQLG